MSYQPSVWPQRIGRLVIGIGFATWAVSALGPTAQNVYTDLVIDQCAANAGLDSAPWRDGLAEGFFAFDGYSQWIVGDTPERLHVITCTRKWAGPLLVNTTEPHPLPGDKSLPYLEEFSGMGGYHRFKIFVATQ